MSDVLKPAQHVRGEPLGPLLVRDVSRLLVCQQHRPRYRVGDPHGVYEGDDGVPCARDHQRGNVDALQRVRRVVGAWGDDDLP